MAPESDLPITGLDVVRFLTELGALAGATVAGASVSWPLAFAAPVAFAGLWGWLVAPKSSRRLDDPARLVVEVALFLAVGGSLLASGHPWAGAVLAIAAIGVAILERRRPSAAI